MWPGLTGLSAPEKRLGGVKYKLRIRNLDSTLIFFFCLNGCVSVNVGSEHGQSSHEDDHLIPEADRVGEDQANHGPAYDAELSQEASTSGQNQPRRRVVQRRTRRVQSKLRGRNRPRANDLNEGPLPASQESQVRDDQARGNNPPNRHLRYLVQNLRACQNNLEKARFMLQYFNGCSFNAGMCPDGVIRFSDDEAAQLSRYVREIDEEDNAEIAEPEV